MSLTTRHALIIAGTLFWSVAVQAEDDCAKLSPDAEVYACGQQKKDNAEKALNAEYAQAKERIKRGMRDSQTAIKEYTDLLIKAQRSWLSLRDYQCQMEVYGGDKNSNVYLDLTNDCITRMDNARTEMLKKVPYDALSD